MIFRKLKLIFVAVGLLLLIILFLNPIDTFLTEESGEGGQELIVRMLDMGQGDAVLLEKAGEFVLIDSGDVTYRPKFKEYLKKYHVKTLESVIITHPHADHIGGMLIDRKSVV